MGTDDDGISIPLAVVGQLGAVAVIAMPAVGVLIRLTAFASRKLDFATPAATAASVPNLALLGAYGAVPPLLFFVAIWRLFSVFGARRLLDREIEEINQRLRDNPTNTTELLVERAELQAKHDRLQPRERPWEKYIGWLAAVGSLVLLVFGPLWFLAVFAGQLIAVFLMGRAVVVDGRLTLFNTLPSLAVILATGVLLGASYLTLPSAHYTLRATTVPSGDYVEVGDDGDLVYLVGCLPSHPEIVVHRSSVSSVEYRSHKATQIFRDNLVGLAKDHHWPTYGVVLDCS